ncbi:aldo/keto reductase [Sphingomonas koreensis]|uniref:aldo/keto reductase n=1 Tax=Sphingomonas koreensis TaxID=93064 RepID=UPI0008371DF0|nr:aldo/keto reductase [Sphingomonas koreensis]PJI89366.1 D-threo-aldose 1-dehydrogenase [Sphingomonas koreensis]RSU59214.1 aldo/keto reductase [Sphingomonas koreensis]RSU68254.1 aldo/keto reductase [Sphingomonas koreensis]
MMERLTNLGQLAFGAASIGNLYRAVPEAQARDVVARAWDAGVRTFDTAPHYGFGLSEKRLGAALAELDPAQSAIVSTKIGRRLDPRPDADLSAMRQAFVSPEPYESVFDYSYDAVMRSYEGSLKRLRRDRIDILYAHDIGVFAHGAAHPRRFAEFMGGGYRAMLKLRDSGAVGAIGIGVNEVAVCIEMLGAGEIDLIMLAGRYTLLEQDPLDDLLPLCARRGVRLVIAGPYNSGILAKGVRHGGAIPNFNYEPAPPAILERVGAIEDVCAKHGVPLAAAALQFPLAHPQVASVVPGMGSVRQVDDALALMARVIPVTLWEELRDAGLIRRDAPLPQ